MEKKFGCLLLAAAMGSVLCLSGCNIKKPEPVSKDTEVSEGESGDGTAVQDETQDETVAQDETMAQDETTAQDESIADTEETSIGEEAVQAVHEPIQRIEGQYISQKDGSTENHSYTYTYDSDMDLVSVSKISGISYEKTYEYLLDAAGNKVKGFHIPGYTLADLDMEDVHKEESLPVIEETRNEDGSSVRTEYVYDAQNQLVSFTDGYNTTSVEHQGNTVIYQEVQGNSACNKWVYTFDDAGHLLSYEADYKEGAGWANAEGQAIEQDINEYGYDSHGSLVSSVYRSVYSGANEKASKTTWEYEYDSGDRPVISKEYGTNGDLLKTVIVTYDTDGKVTEEDFNWKDMTEQEAFALKREFTYNGEGNLECVTVDGEKEWELSYENGLLVTVLHHDIKGPLQEQAEAFEAQIAEYEAAGEVFKKIEAAGSGLLKPMEEYRGQVEQLDYGCSAIRDYSVKNFQVQYDMEGSEWVQGDNQLNYAVERLAKYIPGGFIFSIMAAGAIDNNDQYYENMVAMSDAISDACGECVADVKEAVEKLSMRLYFLDNLTDRAHDKKTQYENQCILQRLYGSGEVSVGQYMDAAREQLYFLGAQQHFLYKLYKTVLTNSAQAEGYGQQYGEILDVLSRSGGDGFVKGTAPQKLEKYLAPVMDAGIMAIRGLDSVPAMHGRDNGFFRLYPQQTGGSGRQVDYCYLNNSLAFLSGFMEIYYADGEPFYANGRYLYDGMVLNPGENTDGAALQEEAEWMAGLPKSTDSQKEFYGHGQRYLAALGEME